MVAGPQTRASGRRGGRRRLGEDVYSVCISRATQSWFSWTSADLKRRALVVGEVEEENGRVDTRSLASDSEPGRSRRRRPSPEQNGFAGDAASAVATRLEIRVVSSPSVRERRRPRRR